jgi:transcriptional regulator with XRE-family HTH domain
MADDIRLDQVLRQLLNERFRNRRRDFARMVNVSESALSQYVRGKATPSLSVLVSIARALDVSLDYLVLGVEPDAPAPDYGALVTHVESAISKSQEKSVMVRDFVGRIGASLAAEIEATATRLLADNSAMLGGGLTAAEVLDLESVSRLIRIATSDLDPDVLLLPERLDDESATETSQAADATFTPVISSNVLRESQYDYVIPEGQQWRRLARRLRDAVSASGLTTRSVDLQVRFYTAESRALTPGYVLYEVDFGRVTARTERLLDRIGEFVDSATGLVALAEPVNRQSHFSLIDTKHHSRLTADHADLTQSCPRLSFD